MEAANVGGVIDIHNHLLPGIDDGPRDMAGTLAMARVAVAEGITRMVCTPHLLPGAVPEPARIAALADETRAALAAADIPLRIDTGAEISLDVAFELDDAALRAYSLAGNGTWVLLEMPFEGWPLGLPAFLGDLEMRGFRAVLAHPERARSVQLQPDRVRDLVGRGALCQVSAEAFTGEFGRVVAQTARGLFGNGLIHLMASDAHSATRRPPGLRAALDECAARAGVEPATLQWMVTDGPQALLDGGDVRPPRLGVPPPRERVAPARPAGGLKPGSRPGPKPGRPPRPRQTSR